MGERKRVLVVDDEEGMRITLAANLELEGYEVVEAGSGARALALVAEQPFSLVVTDIRMPGMNGVELLRQIRRIRPDLAVIMMTGFAVEDLVEEGILEGAYTVLEKPFSMEVVAEVVARAVEGRAVLVVDDTPAVADSIAVVLREAGLRAEVVHGGDAAVEAVRAGRIDVCVLDLVMPGQDGLATCDRILALDQGVAVIVMTGLPVEELITQIAQRGSYACLRKPFEVRDLLRTIAQARGDVSRK
jgi:DNA-binding NtrC family response regulator